MTDFRNFRGAAKPLDDEDLPRIGHRIRVGEDEIHAFIEVETAGGAWDAQRRPKLLFEPHRFYRNLHDPAKRKAAVKAGLAYPNWGEKPYPRDSYPRLLEAMSIDETAALMSASWGLGQVLGENYGICGFESVQEFVLAHLDDAERHLDIAVSFILAKKLDDELRTHNWAAFARGYNGAQYAKNQYDVKLARAFKKWQGIRDTPWTVESTVGQGLLEAAAPVVLSPASPVMQPALIQPSAIQDLTSSSVVAPIVAAAPPGSTLVLQQPSLLDKVREYSKAFGAARGGTTGNVVGSAALGLAASAGYIPSWMASPENIGYTLLVGGFAVGLVTTGWAVWRTWKAKSNVKAQPKVVAIAAPAAAQEPAAA